jgi:hypothetical protein
MTTIHKIVEIPEDRRLHLSLELPDELPPGQAELQLIISPSPAKAASAAWADFAGCLKDDTSFVGDALEIQRQMRNEW